MSITFNVLFVKTYHLCRMKYSHLIRFFFDNPSLEEHVICVASHQVYGVEDFSQSLQVYHKNNENSV